MKTRNLFTILACLITSFCACKKDNGSSTSNKSLSGKWALVRDTDYTGIGTSNQMVVYAGKAGDYFDFRTDGKVYTKEGAAFDTLSYTIKSGSQVEISNFGPILNGVPTVSNISVSEHSAIITTPRILTPGGQFGRDVILTR